LHRASRGIGADTARAFARAGYAVVVGARGIRINVVAPGPINTHHLERAGAEAQRLAATSVPMRRLGTTDDVADVVLWLCSSTSSFVTGVTVPVDGGQLAGDTPPQMYRQGEGMTAT
jgi:NAD(P)-dependent dehydrogenase (short-subunit alcohol dehydrogenase family)